MKKNTYSIVVLMLIFLRSIIAMEPTEAEKKERILEYDRYRWYMWMECGLKLDMPVYRYFSKDGKFIGSRCNCIVENGVTKYDCMNERMTSEEWNEKLRVLEKNT